MIYLKKLLLSILIISISSNSIGGTPPSVWSSISSGFSAIACWFNNKPVAKYLALCSLLAVGGLYGWKKFKSDNDASKNIQKPDDLKKVVEIKKSINVPIKEKQAGKNKQKYGTFDSWYHACKSLPLNIHTFYPTYKTPLTWNDLETTLNDFFACMRNDCMHNIDYWLEDKSSAEKLAQLYGSRVPMTCPFVQKVALPAGSTIAFHGDLHGDIHSLLAYIKSLQQNGYLNGFKICNDTFYMAFLGDYVDRGQYGSEVLYTIMRLKIANPDKVFLVRGNHEDVTITDLNGFHEEFKQKFLPADRGETYQYLSHLYDFLPSALYLGSGQDYLQCCHGGMEMGFDPKPLLANNKPIAFTWLETLEGLSEKAEIQYKAIASKSPEAGYNSHESNSIRASYELYSVGLCGYGFMWNDFVVNSSEKNIGLDPNRGLRYPRNRTKQLLAFGSQTQARVRGVFRAHQHSTSLTDLMMASILEKTDHQGVSKLWKSAETRNQNLWDGIVCTFCVSPDSAYSNRGRLFNYDTYGILTMNNSFDSWTLDVRRNQIICA